jgi:hypothetical protein
MASAEGPRTLNLRDAECSLGGSCVDRAGGAARGAGRREPVAAGVGVGIWWRAQRYAKFYKAGPGVARAAKGETPQHAQGRRALAG